MGIIFARWYVMKYTYMPTGIKRELVRSGVDILIYKLIKLCYKEGDRATPTWVLFVDITGVYR